MTSGASSSSTRPPSSCSRVRLKVSAPSSSCGGPTAPAKPSAPWAPASRLSDGFGEVLGDTVHFDIIDRAGNMVSATPSGGWLQSSPVIPELGFCLGTRAQMFWLEEDHPASLAPGKRPRTTLSPTLALRDGEPYLAWGSPGGDQQDQWTTQFFLRHVHAQQNLQQAIDAPAWHSEHFPISFWPRTARPGVLVLESRVPADTRKELERRGHRGRGRPGMVGGPAHRRFAGRPPPQGRRQSARHAGLRGRPISWVNAKRGPRTGTSRLARAVITVQADGLLAASIVLPCQSCE